MYRNLRNSLQVLVVAVIILIGSVVGIAQGNISNEALNEFFEAAINGDADTVKMCLASGIDPNIKYQGESVLVYAITNAGNPATIKAFIDAGADINKAEEGTTILMYTIKSSNKYNLKNIKVLLDAGTDVNRQDNNGNTTLMQAVLRGSPDTEDRIKLLLSYGADISIKNKEGKDALDIAKDSGKEQIVKLLISNAAKK